MSEVDRRLPGDRTFVSAPQQLPEEKEAEFISDRVGMMVSAIQQNRQKEILQEFEACKSNEEKFSYVWDLPALHEVIQLEPEYNGKSVSEAAKHREKGNKYFQKKSYLSALSEYNESIVQAPEITALTDNNDVKDNQLPLAYGNRSAALLHLNRYHDALVDISLAICSGYPEESLYKLYDRQGRCYLALKDKQNASSCFQKALANVKLSGLDARVITAWETNLSKQLKACNDLEDAGTVEITPKGSKLPKLSQDPQEQYPALSTCVEVKSDKNRGRFLESRQTIKVGEVLAVEEPYASVLFQAHQKTHCYNCMTQLDVPIPCMQCVNIRYCSTDCRQRAWDVYHKYECHFYALFDILLCARIGQLAIRMVMTAGLKYLLDLHHREKNGDPSEKDEEPSSGYSIYENNYKNICKLETHNQDRFPVGYFNFTVAAAFLTKILVATGFFEQDGEDLSNIENVLAIGSIMLRHLQIIQCNGNRIQEAVAGCRFDNPKHNVLGVSIYASAALVNHSCDPTADFNYYGNRVVLRAVRTIYDGEEVTVSYGPVFYDTEYKQRQQQLNYCYFFKCDCLACREQWPTVSRLADCALYFCCEACRKYLDTSENPHKKIVSCPSCQHTMNLEEVIGKLQLSHDTFAMGMEAAFAGRYQEAIRRFGNHLSLMQRFICPPWRDFTSCQASLIHSYRLLEAQQAGL